MATKKGGGDPTEPTKGASTRKSAGTSTGRSAAGRTTRGAAKPNGPAAPTAESGTSRRATTAKTASGRAAAGSKASTTKKTAETSGASAGAKPAARASSRTAARTAGSTGTRRSGGSRANLKKDLRDFASTRPQGWSHDDWLRFLDDLQARGHNINDRDLIGSMLEKERLSLALERIPGLSAQRARTIADRYGYLWRLKETDADQLSNEAKIPRPVAEKVLEGLSS